MRILNIFCCILLTAFVFGCTAATQKKHLSEEYGRAYQSLFEAQVINSKAPDDPSAAQTLPGDIANKMYRERYVKSMTEKPKKDGESVSDKLGDIGE